MIDPLYLPVTDAREVESLLDDLPIAVDRSHFLEFVLGFPRKYLISTARMELVKHYILHQSLGSKAVISSLYRIDAVWKLLLIARERRFLFTNIAGTLSCFGMNIQSAEAFANAGSIVLDTFEFVDRERHFSSGGRPQQFQHFLEEILTGAQALAPLLKERLEEAHSTDWAPVSTSWDNEGHPSSTRLRIEGEDHSCLLYLISRCLSEAGCNIEMAYISTSGTRVRDDFYLTCGGGKLSASQQENLEQQLRLLETAHL